MKNSSFIRDLLVKLLLIVVFIFLLMYLFPMPNLTPFYSSIFNNNIQTMKDAAEDYYTTERMPEKTGESTKMTLQDMIDDKLIIPFVDKDGKECNTTKSYVKVTKKDKEYELKVSLTCGKESNYIIEKIGCYNFCPTGSCTLTEMKKAEDKAIEDAKKPVTTKVDKNGNVSVVVPTGGRWIYEYEYKKVFNDEVWKTGDWTDTKQTETADRKLVDKRTQYTGQKKVTSGTTLYEQVAYGNKDKWTEDKEWTTETKCTGDCKLSKERTLYTGQKKVENKNTNYVYHKFEDKDTWRYDENWTTDTKCLPQQYTAKNGTSTYTATENCQLWKERTLYTGQKKIASGTTMYYHDRYGTKDNWTYDNDWTTEVKKETDKLKLWKERTLFTGQKKVETKKNRYLHVKYGYRYEWEPTGWTTVKKTPTEDIKLKDTRYTVRKTTETTSETCDNWTLDTTWYSGKPADTSTRRYSSTPANTQTSTNWRVFKDSFKSYNALSTYEGDYWYEFLYSNEETCTFACNGKPKVTVYYYRVYEKEYSYKYQYNYCTPKTNTSTSVDEKVVKDPTSYVNSGYTIVKTEYNYDVRTKIKEKLAEKVTDSITPPEGFEYSGQMATDTKVSFVQLDHWVTNKDKLGEYTHNIKTVKQYKYAHNNPTTYYINSIESTSITPPEGYVYSGHKYTTTHISYESLGKWVTNKEALGEYTYEMKTVKQYKYAYKRTNKYLVDEKETQSSVAPEGYVYYTKYTKTIISYEPLGKWVTNIDKLGDYTYYIKTAKQYKYAHRTRERYEKARGWTTNSYADEGYVLTGDTKTTTKDSLIDLGRWVNSREELGEYTHNIKTRTQYKYKTGTITSREEYKWGRTNPGNGFEPTGNYRKTWIQDYAPRNRQK